jgi:hypothetical protein
MTNKGINNPEDAFPFWSSVTAKVKVGCGNLYITIGFNEIGEPVWVRIPRNSKFKCSLTIRDSLARQSTYQLLAGAQKQLIKDLICSEGQTCEEYNIAVKSAVKQGKLAGYTCGDAVARVIQKLIEQKPTKEKKDGVNRVHNTVTVAH